MRRFFIGVTEFFELGFRALFSLWLPPYYPKDVINHMYSIGVQSIPIVAMSAFFTGMVLALQTGHEMAIFGAKMYVGTLVSFSLIRELGPVLTGLVIAGRVGAGTAAELGSMKVTEQIDAIKAIGVDPIKKLVVTRVVAGFFVIPALTTFAIALGLFGGLFVSNAVLGIPSQFYWKTVFQYLTIDDLIMGMVKPFVFGVIIIWIACYCGFATKGGTEGVGRATTNSVVLSSIIIIIGDYFLNQILIWILRI